MRRTGAPDTKHEQADALQAPGHVRKGIARQRGVSLTSI